MNAAIFIVATCALTCPIAGVASATPAAVASMLPQSGADAFPEGCTNTNGGSGSPNTGTHVGGNGTGTGDGTAGGVGLDVPMSPGTGGSSSDEVSDAAGGTGCPSASPGVQGADDTP